jgi:hypothetical protein
MGGERNGFSAVSAGLFLGTIANRDLKEKNDDCSYLD